MTAGIPWNARYQGIDSIPNISMKMPYHPTLGVVIDTCPQYHLRLMSVNEIFNTCYDIAIPYLHNLIMSMSTYAFAHMYQMYYGTGTIQSKTLAVKNFGKFGEWYSWHSLRYNYFRWSHEALHRLLRTDHAC